MKRTRLVAMAGAALALVAVTGCDQNPHDAARVGSRTITVDDVGLMTRALCTEQQNAPQSDQRPPSALSTVTDSAVAALVQSAVDAQYAAAHGLSYDRLSLAQQVEKLDPLIAKLPAADRDRTRTLISDLFRGELQMLQEGARQVQQSGQQPTQQSAQQAAGQLEAAYARKLDIDLNPRYDSAGTGHAGDGFQSVSKGVSSTARSGQSAQPDPSWALGLPASQRCG